MIIAPSHKSDWADAWSDSPFDPLCGATPPSFTVPPEYRAPVIVPQDTDSQPCIDLEDMLE